MMSRRMHRCAAACLLLAVGGGCAFQRAACRNVSPALSRSSRATVAPLAAKAKKKAPAAAGGFGAPVAKSASEKPFKSRVKDAHDGWERLKGDETADVWIACRGSSRWWLVGQAACAAGGDVAGAVQEQKALIFKMGKTLDRTLEQAPDGLVAATAPYGSREAVLANDQALALVTRDSTPPKSLDDCGYEPVIYQGTDEVISVDV